MDDKFLIALETEFLTSVGAIDRVTSLMNSYGRCLSKWAETDQFAETLVQFANIAIETPDAVLRLLRSGHLAQCYVLLRWELELAHLCYYLWEHPEKYQEWLSGKKVQPSDVRKFLDSKNYCNWGETYAEWSNVVHGNASYVEKAWVTSARRAVEYDQLILVGSVLMNVAWLGNKFNHVFGRFLIAKLGKEMDQLTVTYNALEEELIIIVKNQNEREAKLMGIEDNTPESPI